MGYKVGRKIRHKVTNDALIAVVRYKLRKELLEDYETSMEEAMEIISAKADEIIGSFDKEREKRAIFQYEMEEDIKRQKAVTSITRARRFNFELAKLIK